MINIFTSKQLDIILPNLNKALAHVLKDATNKELEVLSKGKDLKSLMNSILKQSTGNSVQDKELLQLLKSNPTLKSLGNISNNIKELLKYIKSDSVNNKTVETPLEKKLEKVLIDIKDLKNSELKQKVENSGIFLESKLKNAKNPLLNLKNELQSLVKELQSSTVPSTKAVSQEAIKILNSKIIESASISDISKNIKENPKSIAQLSANIEGLIDKFKVPLKRADIIYSTKVEQTLQKLELMMQPKALTQESFKLITLKDSIEHLTALVSKSFSVESKGILESLEKIFKVIKSIDSAVLPKTQIEQLLDKKVPNEISKLNENIKAVIQKADPIFSKNTTLILNRLESLSSVAQLNPQSNIKDIISNDLKAIILQETQELVKSDHPNKTELLKHIDKLALQIDYHQLVSHLSNSTSLYIPFAWEQLEEGHIELKKDKENKFYCDIDLKLKEYGELNLKLTLYDKNQLNIHIYSNSSEFKEIIKENIPSLRSSLIESQITPREIRLFDSDKKAKTSPYENNAHPIDIGFEVKV